MINDQFARRVQEVDEYYAFLEQITAPVSGRAGGAAGARSIAISPDLVKILKANAFLLLYNLVESSIREGITYIYDSLQNDGMTYRQLREELRQIWVHECMNPEAKRTPDGLVRLVRELLESAIADQLIEFNPENIPISGNIDARKVRELAARYGFSSASHKRSRGGEVLHRVKTERNRLAHGRISFIECGRDVTYPALRKTKTQLVLYVSNILKNIEVYVDAKSYRA